MNIEQGKKGKFLCLNMQEPYDKGEQDDGPPEDDIPF